MTDYCVKQTLDDTWNMLTDIERKRLVEYAFRDSQYEYLMHVLYHLYAWDMQSTFVKSRLRTAFVRSGLAKELGLQNDAKPLDQCEQA